MSDYRPDIAGRPPALVLEYAQMPDPAGPPPALGADQIRLLPRCGGDWGSEWVSGRRAAAAGQSSGPGT
jgi:hypothetical protein